MEGSGGSGPRGCTFNFLASAFVYALGLEHHSVRSLRVRLVKTDLRYIAHHPSSCQLSSSMPLKGKLQGTTDANIKTPNTPMMHRCEYFVLERQFSPRGFDFLTLLPSISHPSFFLSASRPSKDKPQPTTNTNTPIASISTCVFGHRVWRKERRDAGSSSIHRHRHRQRRIASYFPLSWLSWGRTTSPSHGHGHATCFFGQLFQICHVVLRSLLFCQCKHESCAGGGALRSPRVLWLITLTYD